MTPFAQLLSECIRLARMQHGIWKRESFSPLAEGSSEVSQACSNREGEEQANESLARFGHSKVYLQIGVKDMATKQAAPVYVCDACKEEFSSQWKLATVGAAATPHGNSVAYHRVEICQKCWREHNLSELIPGFRFETVTAE